MNQTTKPSAGKRRLLAACALACAATVVASAPAAAFDWSFGTSQKVTGNGKIMRQARKVGHFTGVAMALPGQVEVKSGGEEGVVIETDDNLLPLIETVVENGTLKLRAKKKTSVDTRNLKIVVQARDLDHLALAGSGSMTADRVGGARVGLDVGGSGSLTVGKAEGEAINVDLGGSGNLKVSGGATGKLGISIGGSGKVDLAPVRADTAKVTIGGSGDAYVWVSNTLNVTVAGSGNVNYYGDPQVSKTVAGSGGAKRLGPAPR